MSIVAKHALEVNGGGTFNVTLVGTGSNRAIYVIGTCRSSATATLNSLTLNGQAGTEIDSRQATSNNYANLSFYVFTEANHPGAGLFTFTPTWSSVLNATYIVLEVDNARQSAPFMVEHNKPAFIEDTETTPLSATLSSSQGKTAFTYVAAVGASFFNSSVTSPSANMSNELVTSTSNETNWMAVYEDADVATTSETYTGTYDNGSVGWTTDNVVFGAFSIDTPEVNVDPQLDTPHPDVVVQEGQIGTLNLGAGFSDGNAGDNLTFSIVPDISLQTGWTFDTNTGDASYDGTQQTLAAADYTITADDGNGGTPATDVVNIEVVPPIPTITLITDARLGESFTVTATNVTDLTTATTVSLTIDGVSAGAPTGTTATTATFTMPTAGIQLRADGVFVLTVDEGVSQNSPNFTHPVLPPTGKQYVTLGTIDPASWLNDPDYTANAGGAANNIGTGDQIIYDSVTAAGGYPVTISDQGLIALSGTTGETLNQTLVWHYLDAQDSYLAGANQTLTLVLTEPGDNTNSSDPVNVDVLPPTGMQAITLTSLDPASWFNQAPYTGNGGGDANNLSAGDQIVIDLVTTENSLPISVSASGILDIDVGYVTANQTFNWYFIEAQSGNTASTTATPTIDPVDFVDPPVITNAAGNVLGATTTLTVSDFDLTQATAVRITRGGVSGTSVNVVNATTVTYVEPISGVLPNTAYDIVLEADFPDGNSTHTSNAFSNTVTPNLGNVVALTVDYANLDPSSFLVGIPEATGLVIGDLIEYPSTVSPSGNALSVSGTGVATITDIGNLTVSQNFNYALWDISGPNTRSNLLNHTEVIDTEAPNLTLPTAVKTGSTTADASVTTDDATGTLYYLISENASESGATIKLGSSVAVSTAGIINVNFTGLTGGTTYYVHFLHTDAVGNDSAVSTSASFITDPNVPLTIVSTSLIRLSQPFTITTTGYDLTTANQITATLNGISLTGLANVTATTCDFTCVPSGVSLVDPVDLILTIDI